MAKNYKIFFILVLIITCNRPNNNTLHEFKLSVIDKYLQENRKINIEKYCGIIDSIPIVVNKMPYYFSMRINGQPVKSLLTIKTDNQEIFCNVKVPFLNKIYINISRELVLISETEETIELNNYIDLVNTNYNKSNFDLYIILTDWNDLMNKENEKKLITFLEKCQKKNLKIIFEYKNKSYYVEMEKRLKITD